MKKHDPTSTQCAECGTKLRVNPPRWSGLWWLDLIGLVLSVLAGLGASFLIVVGGATMVAIYLHLIHFNWFGG